MYIETEKNISPLYGILTARSLSGRVNIGDFIQSLAAQQFYNGETVYIDRDKMSSYDGNPIKLIMNGWYKHHGSIPPTNKIHPLLVSIHLTQEILEKAKTPECLAFFKKHEPVGCRDYMTMNALKGMGIKSYFSSCLTTTLGRTYKRENVGDDIYIVDAFVNLRPFRAITNNFLPCLQNVLRMKNPSVRNHVIRGILSRVDGGRITYLRHHSRPKVNTGNTALFEQADMLLKKYARAKLVITSRIHCALPCLGMGVPVVFINDAPAVESHAARFGGLAELMNTITVDKTFNVHANFDLDKLGELANDSHTFNPPQYREMAKILISRCEEFTAQN